MDKSDGDLLLEEIESFGERAENYEYTNGWGWDDEYRDERAWGDDSWVSDIDDLFEQIDELYQAAEYGIARKAYEKLLDIYFGGNEESQFSGYDQDDMIKTDLEEVSQRYLRCIYLTEQPSSRAKALFDAISMWSIYVGNLNINGMIQASLDTLPDLDQFGREWIDFLQSQKDSRVLTELLKEAVRLFEGTEGLERMARGKGRQFPGFFVEWLRVLKEKRSYAEMIDAATLALKTLPDTRSIRAKIADHLHYAANQLKQKDLSNLALKEALYSSPSLSRLLDLLDIAENIKERIDLVNGALLRFESLEHRERKTRDVQGDWNQSPDLRESYVPENLTLYAHLLKGDYVQVASVMAKSKLLGWHGGDAPNALIIPFFLYARWNRGKSLAANLSRLWDGASMFDTFLPGTHEDDSESKPEDAGTRFREYLENLVKEIPIANKDLDNYFLTAVKNAQKRIDAIVSEKHRKSYDEAAQLIMAIAETYWSNGKQIEGQRLIDYYREKYHRHSAFKNELVSAAKRSKIFSV